MSSYDFLAGCYDRLTYDVDHAAWADYIEKHFAKEPLPGRTILDLACGTGSLTRELALRGYETIGVDQSPEMLAQAAEKDWDTVPIRPLFLCQPMERLDLYGTIDACVCCLDSVNYVTDPKKLARAFQRVHLFLTPGGLFLFDINSPRKLEGLDGQIFLDETEDTYCVWRAEFSRRGRICTYFMDLFRPGRGAPPGAGLHRPGAHRDAGTGGIPGHQDLRGAEDAPPQGRGTADLFHRKKGRQHMTNEIVRAITGDGLVKAAAITGRDIVERARNIHRLLPMGTAALGRTLLGASLMGDMLKEEKGSLTLQIKGGGPLGTILAVSDHRGNVRGYVQDPQVELMEQRPGKLDVGRAVGTDGTLTVIKDIGLKEPYVGSIGLFSGEIADDLAMYFVESEQIPTACALGVLVGLDQSVTAAGVYLIQLLPGAGEDMIGRIEAGVRGMGPVSSALAGGLDGEGLLRTVLEGFDLEILEKHPVEYRCYCSRERVSRALISMGRKDLTELIEEQGQAEMTCQFCDAVYRFSKEELEQLLDEM